jgi:hypothetical protein
MTLLSKTIGNSTDLQEIGGSKGDVVASVAHHLVTAKGYLLSSFQID